MRRTNLLAALLIAPLFLLVTASFLVPVALTLFTAIADREVADALPRTSALLRAWDGKDLPSEAVYAAAAREIAAAVEDRRVGGLSQRLNFERTGFRSLLLRTARGFEAMQAPFKPAMIALDPRWAEGELWHLIKRSGGPLTPLYLLRSVDLTLTPQGAVMAVDPDEAVFRTLFARTLGVSLLVTGLCVVLAYPVAYALARLPPGWANIGLVFVLIPFWSSVLVRTTAWFVLLQREGPVNAGLLALGMADHPLQLVGTRFAVVIAMVPVLLPFAILPAYSVLKRLDPTYLKAAAALGAPPFKAFLRVTLPLSAPGIMAGAFIVFMLAVGFYVTPALVGGPKDQLVASFVAFFMNQGANWGMAAALAAILLAMTAAVIATARLLVPGFRTTGVKI